MFIKSIINNRCFSTSSKLWHFVTTPIYYVNAAPHIGHLYSSVIADAIHRWQQIQNGNSTFKLSTGTDEHGTKIQQAANKNNLSPSDYCNSISLKYKQLAEQFSVDYTDFIRTSDTRHKQVVQTFWDLLFSNNFIYKTSYKGWYCVSDETFLTDLQLREITSPANGEKIRVSSESGHPVEWTEEENYMFKLSLFQQRLIDWVNNGQVIKPAKFQKILLDMIGTEPLPDISISRPSSRVYWGIRVPHDDTQTIYVWLDALVNYLTASCSSSASAVASGVDLGRIWQPPDVQVIGKDILKFHGIYWPAFLMAADLDLPKTILCHSHWTVDGEKMSKSKNNVVCPVKRAEMYTSDGLRYFLLREGVAHSDGNYSDTKVRRILNAELADTLGNLLSRCTGTALNPQQVFPAFDPDAFGLIYKEDVTRQLIENVSNLPEICQRHYGAYNFYKAVDAIIGTLHLANNFFESMRPWQLKKSPDTLRELHAVLHVTMETLRVAAILLQPVIPNLSGRLLNKINIAQEERLVAHARRQSWEEGRAGDLERRLSEDKMVLFRRISTDLNAGEMKQAKRS